MHLSNVSIKGTRFHLPPHNSLCVILFTFVTQLNTNLSLTSATPFSVSYKQTFTNVLNKRNRRLMNSHKCCMPATFYTPTLYKA